MKRRILSLFLLFALIAALLPAAALAAAEPTTVEVRTAAQLNEAINGTADIIKLMDHITLSNRLQIESRTVTLDLNGYMLKSDASDHTIQINGANPLAHTTDGNLTVTDSRANDPTAAHKFDTSTTPWSPADADATGPSIETVYGGVITGQNNICVLGPFTLQGGSIVGCKGKCGGGVQVLGSGSFSMTGGQILGCRAWADSIFGSIYGGYGGGVYVDISGSFTMTGGVIRGCNAAESGNGVYIGSPNAKFYADGGEIWDNVTINDGTLTQSANAKNATVFYGELTKDKGTINGNLVKFMVGEKQYAWEVVVDDKTAVAPEGPQAPKGCQTVWYKDDGTKWNFETDLVNKDITLTAGFEEIPAQDALPGWLTPVLGALNAPTFTDVKSGDWFYDAVRYVNECGLMTGTSSKHFSPNAPVTRGMVMTILARREGIKTDRYSPWYAAGVEWTKSVGISDGTNPEAPITREQLAAMLYRYAGLKGYDLSGAALTSYGDANSISGYATPAVQWAVGAGLLTGAAGVHAGKLLPQQTATRAQLAAMLYRFFG